MRTTRGKLKRTLMGVLLTMLGVNGVALVAAAPAQAASTGRVLADPCLNFRAGYDHGSGWDTMVGCIPVNTTITIECVAQGLQVSGPYGSETIWDRTTWNGTSGYVSDAWVFTGSNAAVAPPCGSSTPTPAPTTPSPPTPTPSPPAPATPAPISGHAAWVSGEQAVRQGCAKILSVAIRGPNETNGPGKEVAAVANQVTTLLPQQISLRQVYIDYPSAPVTSIFTPGQGPSYYFASIDDGITRLRTVLADSARRCGDEKWIISGYSQGALVTHLLAGDFPGTTQLAAAVMIADPARRTSGNGQNFGSAGSHKGVYTTVRRDVALPSMWVGKTLSVCDSRDLVCDLASPYYAGVALGGVLPAVPAIISGGGVHTSYLSRSDELTSVGSIAASWGRRAAGL